MSSIYVSDKLKKKLVRAAGKRGFIIGRGRDSQLADYLAYLVHLDEQTASFQRTEKTLDRALGLLKIPGVASPTDDDIRELLKERRMRDCRQEKRSE